MALLEIRDIRVQFGAYVALSGVNVAIERGARLGVIGPNGAGKSTLVNVVGGQIRSHGGAVILEGADISRIGAERRARRGIARTFQGLDLFERLSVEENVLAAAIAGKRSPLAVRKVRAEVRGVLELLGCDQYAHAPVDQISMGVRVLVGLARAVVRRPKLLLLDEAAAGLSDDDKALVVTAIHGLATREGISLVLIEHDLRFVDALCNDTVVLDAGAVIATGGLKEVLALPEVQEAYLGTVSPELSAGNRARVEVAE